MEEFNIDRQKLFLTLNESELQEVQLIGKCLEAIMCRAYVTVVSCILIPMEEG